MVNDLINQHNNKKIPGSANQFPSSKLQLITFQQLRNLRKVLELLCIS